MSKMHLLSLTEVITGAADITLHARARRYMTKGDGEKSERLRSISMSHPATRATVFAACDCHAN